MKKLVRKFICWWQATEENRSLRSRMIDLRTELEDSKFANSVIQYKSITCGLDLEGLQEEFRVLEHDLQDANNAKNRVTEALETLSEENEDWKIKFEDLQHTHNQLIDAYKDERQVLDDQYTRLKEENKRNSTALTHYEESVSTEEVVLPEGHEGMSKEDLESFAMASMIDKLQKLGALTLAWTDDETFPKKAVVVKVTVLNQ